jgi:hypothetical protein
MGASLAMDETPLLNDYPYTRQRSSYGRYKYFSITSSLIHRDRWFLFRVVGGIHNT